MKIFVALLLVSVLIGSAAAWDDEDYLKVDHTKTTYVQAGAPEWFDPNNCNIEAGGYYKSTTPYGSSAAGVFMQLMEKDTTPLGTYTTGTNPYGNEVSETWTLNQKATAYSRTNAIETNKPEVSVGYTTSQEIHFNGLFEGYYGQPPAAQAVFQSEGNVGVGSFEVAGFANLEKGRAVQAGMVETQTGTTVTDAWIGMASSAGAVWDKTTNLKTFSGSVASWAAFDGAMGTGIVEANAGGYEQHVKLGDGIIITDGWKAGGSNGFPDW